MPRRRKRWEEQIAVDDCWLWTGVTRDGYGRQWVGDGYAQAHRVVYEALVGPIPAGLQMDHLCRVRRCVNPAHLEPVTLAENVRRGVPRCSKITHCPQGHEYTEANTYRPPRTGKRMCRACLRTKPGGSGYRQMRRAAARTQEV